MEKRTSRTLIALLAPLLALLAFIFLGRGKSSLWSSPEEAEEGSQTHVEAARIHFSGKAMPSHPGDWKVACTIDDLLSPSDPWLEEDVAEVEVGSEKSLEEEARGDGVGASADRSGEGAAPAHPADSRIKIERMRYDDKSLAVWYRYSPRPGDDIALKISSLFRRHHSELDARKTYHFLEDTWLMTFEKPKTKLRFTPDGREFSWGDDSNFAVLIGEDGPIANLLLVRRGNATLLLSVSSGGVPDAVAAEEFYGPILERIWAQPVLQ